MSETVFIILVVIVGALIVFLIPQLLMRAAVPKVIAILREHRADCAERAVAARRRRPLLALEALLPRGVDERREGATRGVVRVALLRRVHLHHRDLAHLGGAVEAEADRLRLDDVEPRRDRRPTTTPPPMSLPPRPRPPPPHAAPRGAPPWSSPHPPPRPARRRAPRRRRKVPCVGV